MNPINVRSHVISILFISSSTIRGTEPDAMKGLSVTEPHVAIARAE